MAQVLGETATADCPLMEIHLTGQKDKDALEAWETANTAIAAWSEDGYAGAMKLTSATTYFEAQYTGNQSATVAWGVEALSTGTKENGAYGY